MKPMNAIKIFLALTAILCVSTLYAEESNTYIKQQVAYKGYKVSKFHASEMLVSPLRYFKVSQCLQR